MLVLDLQLCKIMSKILKIAITILFLLFLSECKDSNEENISSDKRELEIIVKYEDQWGIHADVNANIYVYYGIYIADIIDYTYSSNGILKSEDKILMPNITIEMKGKEQLITYLDNYQKITIIVESGIYKQKIMTYSISPDNKPIKYTCIFPI